MKFPGRNKFGNTKTVVGGERFDSKAEARRWSELRLLEWAGEIFNLRRQVKYVLIPKQDGERECSYVADFVYDLPNADFEVEDVKGMKTPDYVIKRKLMLHVHGIRVREIGKKTKQKGL